MKKDEFYFVVLDMSCTEKYMPTPQDVVSDDEIISRIEKIPNLETRARDGRTFRARARNPHCGRQARRQSHCIHAARGYPGGAPRIFQQRGCGCKQWAASHIEEIVQHLLIDLTLEIRQRTEVHLRGEYPLVVAELLVIQPGLGLVAVHEAEEIMLLLPEIGDAAFLEHTLTFLGRIIVAIRSTGLDNLVFIRFIKQFIRRSKPRGARADN